jgi:acetyltransferase-like isoleucine patch superfamily enzyme
LGNYFGKLDRLVLGANCIIGDFNWMPGFPRAFNQTGAFSEFSERLSQLIMHPESAITNRHWVDCVDMVEVGSFVTIAGIGCQLITHGIEIETNRQTCAPIVIGPYCLVGSRTIIVKGVVLPPCTVVGAGSIVAESFQDSHCLIAGTPARVQRKLSPDAGYFNRHSGVVS